MPSPPPPASGECSAAGPRESAPVPCKRCSACVATPRPPGGPSLRARSRLAAGCGSPDRAFRGSRRRPLGVEPIGFGEAFAGEDLQQFLREHVAIAGPLPEVVQRVKFRDLAAPTPEIAAGLKLAELAPHHHAGLLQDVFGVRRVRHQRQDVAQQRPMMPQQQGCELFVREATAAKVGPSGRRRVVVRPPLPSAVTWKHVS